MSVLGPARLTVRSGYKDRFVVELAPDDFPGAPALLIHLGKRVKIFLRREGGVIPVPSLSLAHPEAGQVRAE